MTKKLFDEKFIGRRMCYDFMMLSVLSGAADKLFEGVEIKVHLPSFEERTFDGSLDVIVPWLAKADDLYPSGTMYELVKTHSTYDPVVVLKE